MTLIEYFAKKPRGAKAEMAQTLGISKTWMAQIINGRVLCSADLALKIQAATKGKVKLKDILQPVEAK